MSAGLMTFPVHLEPALPLPWALLVVAALAAAVVGIAWRRPLPLPRSRRVTLLVLRLLVVLAVALALLRPVVEWRGRENAPAQVALLLDASRSMAVRDGAPEKVPGTFSSRIETVRQALSAAAGPYADLGRRAVIKRYAFGTHLRPLDERAVRGAECELKEQGAAPLNPQSAIRDPQWVAEDPRTDIADALDAMLETVGGMPGAPLAGRAAGATDSHAHASSGGGMPPAEQGAPPQPLAAVVLVSDGRANRARGSPEAAARQLAERGIKVHALVVGSAAATDRVRDVAVRDLRAPARIATGQRPEVRCTVALLGLAGRPVEAVLTLGGKEVERRRLAADSNLAVQEIVFTPLAETAGLVPVAVAVEPLPGELVATNNRADTTIRVDDGAVRVLYLDGRIHPEGKYAARALEDTPEIALDRRILVGGGALPGPADLDASNVLILGDLPASALPAATVAYAATRIREGKLGLLAVGGPGAFGSGGWAATPLAEVLPFALRPGDGRADGPLPLRPAPDALRHFIFRGDAAAPPMVFDGLPPLAGANQVGPLAAGARLLASAPDGRPLLAVREPAGGRVAALTADTTWQWVLAPAQTHGADIHRRLWRQLVLWLAGRDDKPPADLWVATDRPRYLVIDPDRPPAVEVTVEVRGSAGGAMVPNVRLTGPDGGAPAATWQARPLPLAQADGQWRAVVTVRQPGTYTVEAEAVVAGAARRAETRFVVEEQDWEFANLLADADGLGRIAWAGGGSVRPVEQLGDLLKELAALPPRQVEALHRLPPASGRAFLAAFLGLLAAEWFLRRAWGMA